MFVWSKRVAIAALILFVAAEAYLIPHTIGTGPSEIRPHMIQYIFVNYSLLAIWVFIWMFDQARIRGANVWLWLPPFLFAPLPTLLIFILFLQRPQRVGG
jgi:hypothetical protein